MKWQEANIVYKTIYYQLPRAETRSCAHNPACNRNSVNVCGVRSRMVRWEMVRWEMERKCKRKITEIRFGGFQDSTRFSNFF